MTGLKKLASLLLINAVVSTPSLAVERKVFSVSAEPSEKTKAALPMARCIWTHHYQDSLAYANRLEKGMRRDDILKQLDELKAGCTEYPEGDIIQAIVSIREEQVGVCLRNQNRKDYDKFAHRMKRHQESEEAKAFITNGFPPSLSSAISACDPSLQDSYRPGYRKTFGIYNFGWNWL